MLLILGGCATTKNTNAIDNEVSQAVEPVATPVTQRGLDRTKVPEPGPAPEIQLGEYESFTLDNGLKVFVVENRKLPRVAFSLVLDIDPLLEGENAGYVSAAGQLLTRGTQSRTKAQLDEEVDFIGASLSSSSSSVFASSLTKHIEKLLELMSDVTLRPSFSAEELDKIKKETISALQANKEDPSAIAGDVRSVLRYGKDHPYGEIITEESVGKIDIEACQKYYQNYFRPNVAYLAIVGDINTDRARALVQKYFGNWEAEEVPKREYETPQAPQQTQVAMVDRPQSVQSVINITYPVNLKPGHPDVIKARVMNTILGGGFSSNLMQNLREKNAYTYGARSSLSSDKLVGSFNAAASVRNEVTDSAVVQFMVELNRIRTEPVSEKQLQSIKNYITGSFARSLESPSTIANFALNIERYGLPRDYYANYLKNIEQVTIADVQEMAQKYIKPDNAYILVVGKAAEVADDLKQFGKVQYYDIYGDPYTPTTSEDLPEGLTAEKVIDHYLEAIGGVQNLRKVKDLTQVRSASMQGMTLEITEIKKAPNMSLEKVSSGPMEFQKVIFNGSEGLEVIQGQSQSLDEKKVDEAMIESRIFPELSYGELGAKLTLTGLEKVDNQQSYVVEVELPTGKKSYSYFSKESGLKLKESVTVDTPQGTISQSVMYSDYKEVDGVRFPHKASINMGPQILEAQTTRIEINTGVSDDLFKWE